MQKSSELLENDDVISKVTAALIKMEQYQEAGELYEVIQKPNKALECYRKGHVYIKAVELAKFVSPKGIRTIAFVYIGSIFLFALCIWVYFRW